MPPKKKTVSNNNAEKPMEPVKTIDIEERRKEVVLNAGSNITNSKEKEESRIDEEKNAHSEGGSEEDRSEDDDESGDDTGIEKTEDNIVENLLLQIEELNRELKSQASEIRSLKKEERKSPLRSKRNERKTSVESIPPSISRKGSRHRRHNRSALMLTPLTGKEKKRSRMEDESESSDSEDDYISDREDELNNSNRNKKWRINVAPDKFCGNLNEDIRIWLFQFEQCMIINQIPESMWTQLSFPYLKDNAAIWYLSTFQEKDTSKYSWNKFKKMIKSTFEPYDNSTLLRSKLKSLKQGNDLDVYIKEIRLILMQLPDMSELDKIEYFIDGLKPKTQKWIRYERAQTLEQAIEYATSYERSFFGSKPKESKQRSLKNDESKQKSKKVECYLCKGRGHYATSCPKRFQLMKKEPEKKSVKPKNEDKTITSISSTNNKDGCWVMIGNVNNITAKCLIDTGSDSNHISATFVKNYRLISDVNNDKLKIELGLNNVATEIEKRSIELDLQLENINSKEVFYVWDINKKFDIILGFSYFKNHMDDLCQLLKKDKNEIHRSHTISDRKIERKRDEVRKSKREKINKDVNRKNGKSNNEITISLIAIEESEREIETQTSEWIKEIFEEFNDIISDETPSYNSKIPFEHNIELLEKSIPKKRLYRLSPRELKEMNKQVKELLRKGLIQKSESPFGAPIVFAKKSDGSLRMCIDYRALNQITKLNRYPIPNISELFDIIGKAKVFTKLDLKSGYYQIKMQKGSIEYTAFITPYGHYEWLVMPFGLMNAPSTFQSAMNDLLREYLNVFVVVYLDDIVIFSNSVDDHKKHVRLVMNKLKEYGLIVAKKKCEWERKCIRYLGHIIGNGTISPDDQKISIVKDWKRPENLKEIQRFLGFINYYSRFIKNYANIAKPLFVFSKTQSKFEWKSQHEKAFNELKEALLNYQSLVCPDINKPFTIYTDASDTSIGSVLMQETSSGLQTVSMRSRCLKGSELNYSTYDKELLAIHDAFMHWRYYLDGNSFVVMTDHNPLVHLFKQDQLNQRQVRWINNLWNQKMEIKYIKGKENVVADALSRLQINHISTIVIDEDLEELSNDYMKDSYFKDIWTSLINNSTNEKERKKRKVYERRFKIDEGKLYWIDKEEIKLCLPKGTLRTKVLHTHHESLVGGHQGVIRTYDALSKKFYFPRMRKIVEKYVTTCIFCQRNKAKNQQPIGLLQPLEIPEEPWDTVSMDFIVKLPLTKSGNDSIVVFVCKLTKRVILRALKTTASASDVAKIYLDAVVREHGISRNFICDRDSKFTSKFWKSFVELLGIKLKMSTAFHPETDGQTERANRVIQDCLRHYVNFEQNNWDELLGPIEYVLNSCKQTSTNYSPFELDYGRKIRYPTDFLLETQHIKRKIDDRDVDKLIDQHRFMIRDAIESLRVAQINQQLQANNKRRDYSFKVGIK